MEFKQKKVLIVDDNQTYIMYIAILLKRMGFTIIPARTALEANNFLKIIEPDMIMLDVQMPSMDGITFLEHIKNDKQTSRIPVVMVSVDASNETIEKCKKLGCSDYLVKPFKIERLHEVLQNCVFSQLGQNRKNLRATYNKRIEIIYKGTLQQLYAETLSEKGIYLRAKEPFPVGSELEIKLLLQNDEVLHLKGVVIYIKGIFGDLFRIPPGMAIEFKNLTSDTAKTLKDYVVHLLAGDLIETQEEVIIEKNK
jgi:CheY-like chemotaxis protein